MKQSAEQPIAEAQKDDSSSMKTDMQISDLQLRMNDLDHRVIMLQERQGAQVQEGSQNAEVLTLLADLFDHQINAVLRVTGCTPSSDPSPAVTSSEQPREYALGFGSTAVPGKSSANIGVQPQVIFRPERLVIPASIAEDFLITDIKVGKNSQLVSTGAIPASAFTSRSEATRMKMDTAQISMFVTISVTNISKKMKFFQAVLFGPPKEDDWLSSTPSRFSGRRFW